MAAQPWRVASWNVNSLRVRPSQLAGWLEGTQPDVIGLQETKLVDAAFPHPELAAPGCRVAASGQKACDGVALLARAPLIDSVADFEDPQRRLLAASCEGKQSTIDAGPRRTERPSDHAPVLAGFDP